VLRPTRQLLRHDRRKKKELRETSPSQSILTKLNDRLARPRGNDFSGWKAITCGLAQGNMGSDESQEDNARRIVEKLGEIVAKTKEAIESISGYPLTSVQGKRQFWALKLQNVFLGYKTRKYVPLPVLPNLQQVLKRCSSSVPSDRSRRLVEVAEDCVNPFQKIKPDVGFASEIINEAFNAAEEIEEKPKSSKGSEEAWVRSKALADVYQVMKTVDFEKAKGVGSNVLKIVDDFLSEEEKTSGKQSMLYGRALVHAVEVVSKIDAEKALRIAEGIELGEERAEALIYILESYVYSLIMMGARF
jgi:hypothetical protein